jgi:uncharacterized membrane protein SirB2
MISYEVYKFIHFFCLILIVLCLAANTLLPKPVKWARMTGMIASLFLFVAGMGLLARTGQSHGEPWPIWVKLKVSIWFVLAVGGPVLIKRMPQHRTKILVGGIFLLVSAVSLVIFRPM